MIKFRCPTGGLNLNHDHIDDVTKRNWNILRLWRRITFQEKKGEATRAITMQAMFCDKVQT